MCGTLPQNIEEKKKRVSVQTDREGWLKAHTDLSLRKCKPDKIKAFKEFLSVFLFLNTTAFLRFLL